MHFFGITRRALPYSECFSNQIDRRPSPSRIKPPHASQSVPKTHEIHLNDITPYPRSHVSSKSCLCPSLTSASPQTYLQTIMAVGLSLTSLGASTSVHRDIPLPQLHRNQLHHSYSPGHHRAEDVNDGPRPDKVAVSSCATGAPDACNQGMHTRRAGLLASLRMGSALQRTAQRTLWLERAGETAMTRAHTRRAQCRASCG